MKKLIYGALIALSISACSDKQEEFIDNGNDPDLTEEKVVTAHLEVTNYSANIFEPVNFKLVYDTDSYFGAFTINVDSIIWEVPGEGKIKVISDSNIYRYWGHHFFRPGNYETYLLSYKNGEVVARDTSHIVSIYNEKDFLAYNWDEVKPQIGALGFMNILHNDNIFAIMQDVYQGVPAITLFITEKSELPNSKEILSNYMTSLYKWAPCYESSEDPEFMDKYKGLFNHKKANTQPVKIWLTTTSKIVLLKYDESGQEAYQIYAEPK